VNGLDVVKRFLGFIDTSEEQDAESLYCHIMEYLEVCKLDKIKIVVQSYDDANVMS